MSRSGKRTGHRERKSSGRNPGRLLFLSGTALVLAAVFLLGKGWYEEARTAGYCEQILEELLPLIPERTQGMQPEVPEGQEMVEVGGVSCVGILEIPQFGERWPVAGAYEEETRLPVVRVSTEESDREGETLIIEDAWSGEQFGEISPEDIGEQICFTDVQGREFTWVITAVVDGKAAGLKDGLLLRTREKLTGKIKTVVCE